MEHYIEMGDMRGNLGKGNTAISLHREWGNIEHLWSIDETKSLKKPETQK